MLVQLSCIFSPIFWMETFLILRRSTGSIISGNTSSIMHSRVTKLVKFSLSFLVKIYYRRDEMALALYSSNLCHFVLIRDAQKVKLTYILVE